MSVLYLFSGALIAVGTPVVISNGVTGTVEPFDALVHNVEDVIGVVYPKLGTSERITANSDGPIYYTNDYTLWSDELTTTNFVNPNYGHINLDLSSDYVRICVHGFAPVLKAFVNTLPARWKKLSERTTHDWYVL